MKKVLFVCDSLRMGGIQKSLKTLLQSLDYSKYEISLYLFNDTYPNDLPKEIHAFKSNFLLRTIALTRKEAKEKGIFIYTIRMILAILCKILGANFVYSFIFLFTKKIGPFDTAISYSNNGNSHSTYFGCNAFVLKKVTANKKIAFLHVNYDAMNMDNKYNKKEYPQFDKIACVSIDTKKTFLKHFKQLKNKVEVVYNLLPVSKIKGQGNNPYPSKRLNIITASRLDNNKNVLVQLEIAKELKKYFTFGWYILGEGPDRALLENYISNNHLENYVFLLGDREDTYGYLKYADIYISTSKSESYGLSIAEALYLGTPVLALDYPALKEIINNKDMICKDKEDMKTKLINLLENKDNLKKLNQNLSLNYDEEKIIKQIETLF